MEKKNKSVGIIGYSAIASNANADFEGLPRTYPDGSFYTTDRSFKYSVRRFWENESLPVFISRTLKIKPDKKGIENISPMDIQERYNKVFFTAKKPGVMIQSEVFKNLMSCVDVMNFGILFAATKCNIPINGAVQINNSINLYDDTSICKEDISTSMRAGEDKDGNDKEQTTLGKKYIVDEAHYLHQVTVNPNNYKLYKDLYGDGFEGYTEEAYKAFKEACLYGVTAYNSCTKMGCRNEFAMFIDLKDGCNSELPNLQDFVKYTVNKEGKNIIDLTECMDIITQLKDMVESIEIYHDPYKTEVVFPKNVIPASIKVSVQNLYLGLIK